MRFFRKIYLRLKGAEIWDAKMSESLRTRPYYCSGEEVGMTTFTIKPNQRPSKETLRRL